MAIDDNPENDGDYLFSDNFEVRKPTKFDSD